MTCPSSHNLEAVELRFEVKSVWHQNLCSELLSLSDTCIPANPNPCTSLIGLSLIVSGNIVKIDWLNFFFKKNTDSHHHACVHSFFFLKHSSFITTLSTLKIYTYSLRLILVITYNMKRYYRIVPFLHPVESLNHFLIISSTF